MYGWRSQRFIVPWLRAQGDTLAGSQHCDSSTTKGAGTYSPVSLTELKIMFRRALLLPPKWSLKLNLHPSKRQTTQLEFN
eukprot:COSAG02_NODE_5032_length_4710_cov_1.603512_2_plen_80_part_00